MNPNVWQRALVCVGSILASHVTTPVPLRAQDVVINELLAANLSGSRDEDDDRSDWVEVANFSATAVQLAEYGMSDDARDPFKWVFSPLRLEPGEFRRIWCSGKDRSALPALHTNFKLSQTRRETVFLTRPNGESADSVRLPVQVADRSYGRFPDGSEQFRFMALPTPGTPNSDLVSETLLPTQLVEVRPPPGRYETAVTVEVVSRVELEGGRPEGLKIRYTLDGSAPGPSSPLYTQPLPLTEDTALRAALFAGAHALDEADAGTYYGLSNISRDLQLPVLGIVMDPEDFRTVHLDSQARGRDSERVAQLEIFDDEGRVAARSGFGLRLHGGAGRSGPLGAKKSYKAYFRRAYGAGKLKYRLFEDTDVEIFDKLVLRANFNDAFRDQVRATLIRDQLSRDLYQEMGAVVSHGTWRNVFINGEYRGVYNIVERMDREFLESHRPANDAGWDVIKTRSEVLDGTAEQWLELRSFLKSRDATTKPLYDEVARRIDLPNFTAYMILNIWQDNHDWPQNNWYAARPRTSDGKWIFLNWDAEFILGLDATFEGANTFHAVFRSNDNLGPTAFRVLLSRLLKDPRYRNEFADEVDRYLEGVLSPTNVITHARRLATSIRPDVREELARTNGRQEDWEANLEHLHATIRERGPQVRHQVFSHPGFTFPYVTSVEPGFVLLQGEQEVALSGARFTSETTVLFGDLPAVSTRWVDANEMRSVIPLDSRLEGSVYVTVVDPKNGSRTTRGSLTVNFPDQHRFRRGDVNADGVSNITDVLVLLGTLRGVLDAPPCVDALDVDDSGHVQFQDAVALLDAILLGRPGPEFPPLGCEEDRTADRLPCIGGNCVDW